MAITIQQFISPTFVVADTQLNLDSGDAFECQITAAEVTTTVAKNQVPATGCQGPAQIPSAPSYALSLAWLQDWAAGAASFSRWSRDHVSELVWFRLTGDDGTVAEGQAYCVPGAFGGEFGGAVHAASAVWDCVGDVPITTP